jgi:hypothetical protein
MQRQNTLYDKMQNSIMLQKIVYAFNTEPEISNVNISLYTDDVLCISVHAALSALKQRLLR